MGGGTPGDGRLELDDLDGVLGAASVLADGEPDVLEAGAQWRWTDRVAESRAVRWSSAHRRLGLVVVGAVVLVAAGTIAFVARIPPPVDTEFHVLTTSVDPDVPSPDDLAMGRRGGFVALFSSGVTRVAVGVTPLGGSVPGTAYRVVGFTGPAVRASRAVMRAQPTLGDITADIDVTLDCADDASLDARTSDYRLLLARTDAYGRYVTGEVPLNDLAEWGQYVSSTCMQQQLDSSVRVEDVAIATDPAHRALDLVLAVRNGIPRRLTLLGPEDPQSALSTSVPQVDLVPAGRSSVPARLTVHDCQQVAEPEMTSFEALSGERSGYGVGASANLQRGEASPEGYVSLWWSSAVEARVRAALRRVCVGAPHVAVGAVTVGPARPTDRAATAWDLPLQIQLRTTGTRASILSSEDGVSELSAGSAQVRAGRAVLPATYRFSCESLPSPMTVQLRVDTDHGTYPFLHVLDDAVLGHAMIAVCGDIPTPSSFSDSGWQSMAPAG